jgi:hypothetical protein
MGGWDAPLERGHLRGGEPALLLLQQQLLGLQLSLLLQLLQRR